MSDERPVHTWRKLVTQFAGGASITGGVYHEGELIAVTFGELAGPRAELFVAALELSRKIAEHERQAPLTEDPIITVALPRSQWEELLTIEPLAKETYTPSGLATFNAFQAIHQALNPEKQDEQP